MRAFLSATSSTAVAQLHVKMRELDWNLGGFD
jgi:hypothetical protein